MAVEITVARSDGQPLGTRDAVVNALSRHLPGVEFGWTQSGNEKLDAMSVQGVDATDSVRAQLAAQPAQYEGVWETDDWTAQFFLGDPEVVRSFGAALGGDIDKGRSIIQLVCDDNGWAITA